MKAVENRVFKNLHTNEKEQQEWSARAGKIRQDAFGELISLWEHFRRENPDFLFH